MKQEIHLSQFSGPLDLLLSLIQDKKLQINTIALSEVTEQFLHYLDTLEEENAEELADFLVIAAKLLLLKAKYLLPHFRIEEDDESGLEEQLRLYKKFVKASRKINKLWLGLEHGAFRYEPPRKVEGFVPPQNVSQSSLQQCMMRLLERLTPPKKLPETKIDRAVSMKAKIDSIRALLATRERAYFFEIVGNVHNKTDIIVSFLALLELVKQKSAQLHQEEAFADIEIHAITQT